MYSIDRPAESGKPPLHSACPWDPWRERIRRLHYSIRTEHAHVHRVRLSGRWHGRRHPREMGCPEVEAFLTHPVNARHLCASTHRQALSARRFPSQGLRGHSDVGTPVICTQVPKVAAGAVTGPLDRLH